MAYCILCGDLRSQPHVPDCPFAGVRPPDPDVEAPATEAAAPAPDEPATVPTSAVPAATAATITAAAATAPPPPATAKPPPATAPPPPATAKPPPATAKPPPAPVPPAPPAPTSDPLRAAALPATPPPGGHRSPSRGGLMALIGLGLVVAAVGGVLAVNALSDSGRDATTTAARQPASIPTTVASGQFAAPVVPTTAPPTTVAPTSSVPVVTATVVIPTTSPAATEAPTPSGGAAAPVVAARCAPDVTRPVTGTELGPVRVAGLGTLTVENGLATDATVKLVGQGGGRGVMHRYVRAGERLVVPGLPGGTYRVLFEEGRSWNPAEVRFTCGRAIHGFDQPVVFDESTAGGNVVRSEWTVVLQPVANANASVSAVAPAQFDAS